MFIVIAHQYFQLSWLLPLLSSYLVFSWFMRFRRRSVLKGLVGVPAPRIRTWIPFGLGIVYRNFKATRNSTTLDLWDSDIKTHGTVESPHTVETKLGSVRYIVTADHEVIKHVLTTINVFEKGELFNRQWHDFLGDNVFTTDGEHWHAGRRRIRHIMVKERMADLLIFEKHSQKLLNLIQGDGQETAVQNLFFQYALDIASEFLFGETVGSMDKPQANFAVALAEVQKNQALLAFSGPLYWLMPRGKLRKGKKTINSLIRPYLDRALSITDEELENNSNSSSKKFTFLHALARTTRDRQEINDELVGLLFAGRDTTAATLSWLFYELSDHPAMVQKIRSEIDDVLGPDSKRMPTLEELKRMKYLRNTVDETLRLYPPVPINVRHAARDTIISTSKSSQPLLVRKGDAVAYSTYLLQRRPDLCPPASSTFAGPNDFCPERWDHWTPAPWTYIPFNGGPRICVGQQFALTEIYFTTVRILQRFERLERVDDPQIGIDGDDRKQFMSSHIVGQPGRPVRVKFSERSQE